MSQILHIFRKDVRHLWWEILVSLALLALYTWHEPETWSPLRVYNEPFQQFLWHFVPTLVVFTWALLIVRGVQDENLVGDRQLWVTRPYEWPKLLAAKILFIIAFVSLPLFVVDLILLHEGGFAISSHIGGLLSLQATMALIVFFPILVGATIVRNLGQFVLLAIGLVVCLIAVTSIQEAIPDSGMSNAGPQGTVTMILVYAALLFVVFWQYIRRAAWPARVVLVGTLLVVILIGVATPYRSLINREFPLSSNDQAALAHFAFDADAPHSPAHGDVFQRQKNVSIQLPLKISGIQADVIAVRGILVEIEGPSGFRGDSRWQGEFSPLQPDETHFQANFDLDRKAFDAIKSTPAKLRVSLALTGYRLTDNRTIVATSQEFSLFKADRCSVVSLQSPFVQCFAALTVPSYFAAIDPADLTCPPQIMKDRPISTLVDYERLGGEDSALASPGISPIDMFGLNFWDRSSSRPGLVSICSGTKINLSKPHPFENSRVEIEIDGVRLEEYLPKPENPMGAGETGISIFPP